MLSFFLAFDFSFIVYARISMLKTTVVVGVSNLCSDFGAV